MILLLLLAQATTDVPAKPPGTETWSILLPIGGESRARRATAADGCVPAKDGNQEADSKQDGGRAAKDEGGDIIVCGQPLPSQTLPYPNEVIQNSPQPSNPYMTGIGALNAGVPPCPGCDTETIYVPLAKEIVHGVKNAFRKRPDKTGRVPIDLDDQPPPKSVILP